MKRKKSQTRGEKNKAYLMGAQSERIQRVQVEKIKRKNKERNQETVSYNIKARQKAPTPPTHPRCQSAHLVFLQPKTLKI